MSLTPNQLKTLALELSAAMPPVPAPLTDHEDAISDAMDSLLEGIAISEMAWRIKLCNSEDAEMLQRASLVAHRLLEQSRSQLAKVKNALDQQLAGGLA